MTHEPEQRPRPAVEPPALVLHLDGIYLALGRKTLAWAVGLIGSSSAFMALRHYYGF